MVVTFFFISVLLDFAVVRSAEADPCLAHKLLGKMDIRGTSCLASGKVYCDRLIDGGWYKAVYEGAAVDMPTACVNPTSCGTAFPIWLNGTLPNISEGIVQKQACVRGLSGEDCCIRTYDINVKNCGTYNVYHLPYTVACDEAYCFGDQNCDLKETKPSSPSPVPNDTAAASPVPERTKDPCFAHKLIGKMSIRGTRCSASGNVYCDRLIDGGWYKAVYKGAAADMPTSSVNPTSCGTAFPIWLKGELPKEDEGIVKRQACVRGLSQEDRCIRTYNISVKNCGTYNVYNLPYTEACDEAYCFGNHDCGLPETKPTSSAPLSGTSTISTSVINGDAGEGPWSPNCYNRTDVVAIVAGCLVSAAVGSLVTLLLLHRCDGSRRGKIFQDKPGAKTRDPFYYSIFNVNSDTKSEGLNSK